LAWRFSSFSSCSIIGFPSTRSGGLPRNRKLMTIDWAHFTPVSALVGGVLIGAAAVWLILVDGRILGASGVLGGLVPPRGGDIGWRLALLAGLVLSPPIASVLFRTGAPVIEANALTIVAAGALVGFGTRLGNGCTSGHGVCGLARLSPRSLAATVAFMAAGFATVYVVRHVLA
jgi:uncharacterized protein